MSEGFLRAGMAIPRSKVTFSARWSDYRRRIIAVKHSLPIPAEIFVRATPALDRAAINS
jgi:hypothetical protein